MPGKVLSFRTDEDTVKDVIAAAQAAHVSIAVWLAMAISNRLHPDGVVEQVALPEGETVIIVQHGQAGHRHTTKSDRCGYWCKDDTCEYRVVVDPV